VVGIRRALEILQVAGDAGVAGQVVIVVNVTVGAGAGWDGMQSGERKSGRVVVELRIRPVAGAMALLAGLRETRCDVVGIRRALEVPQVAGHACGAAQGVIIIDVTIRALARRNGVQSGQRKASHRMIELGIAPLHRIVAAFARVREPAMRHRSGRAGEIFLMTAETRHRTQGVIVVHMAVGTLPRWNRVSPGQNESGRAVVETRNLSVQPVVCGMTVLAIGREVGFCMTRVAGRREIPQVARVARRRHDLEFAVGAVFVAGIAVYGSVSACQREAVVVLLHIFHRNLPSAHRVALLAVSS